MSTPQNPEIGLPADTVASTAVRSKPSLLDRLLKQLSAVPFGVTLLMLLIALSMAGMLIMQVNVEGFDKYYAALTPSQRWLYTDPILQALRNITGLPLAGWNILSLVDIYKSYVFITLLAIVSLNIVLASIDHFPGAWRYVRRKKLTATKPYVLHQTFHSTLPSEGDEAEPLRIAAVCRHLGFRPTVTREAKRTTVFAERGAWNRLGAYFVHVGLLTIFLAGFFTWRSSFNGSLTLEPGEAATTMNGLVYDVTRGVAVREYSMAPLTIECTDIQQTLINPTGSLDASNTIDWFTRVRVTDAERGTTVAADVHMNKPFDYRGYRFFQSSYQPTSNARSVTLEVRRPGAAPESVALVKRQPTTLADGTKIMLADFTGNATAQNGASDYGDPAALLSVVPAGTSAPLRVEARPDGTPGAEPAGGTTYVLQSYEKVGGSHTLAVQYDPYGAWTFYVGSVILIAALASVFFASHQRIWFVLETDKDGAKKIYAGGHTNRNRPAFEKRFNLAVDSVRATAPTTEGGAA